MIIMIIMKKIILIFLIIMTLTLSSCSNKNSYTDAEIFGARAAYTISRHIGDATSFVITYIDYTEENDTKKVNANCALYYTKTEFKSFLFVLGVGEYFENKEAEGKAVYDEKTGLYMVNFGDTFIAKNEENKLDDRKILKLFNEYLKTGDGSLIGIE